MYHTFVGSFRIYIFVIVCFSFLENIAVEWKSGNGIKFDSKITLSIMQWLWRNNVNIPCHLHRSAGCTPPRTSRGNKRRNRFRWWITFALLSRREILFISTPALLCIDKKFRGKAAALPFHNCCIYLRNPRLLHFSVKVHRSLDQRAMW